MQGTKIMLLIFGPVLYGVTAICGSHPFILGIHKCITVALLVVVVAGIFSSKKPVKNR